MSVQPTLSRKKVVELFGIGASTTIREAIACIDQNAEGVALVLTADGALGGIITDGDVRRGLMANVDMDQPISVLLDHKADPGRSSPLTAPIGTPVSRLVDLMNEHGIRHIPIVDADNRVEGLALLSELVRDSEAPLQAVVMAGGYGMRLRPMTDRVPKPLLPVGGRPVMERVIDQLRQAGIRNICVTTHYLADSIRGHFGDGSGFGVEIQYTQENEPLGTAGALATLKGARGPMLVMNADILSTVDFRAMLTYHREQKSDLTVGVRKYDITVPYGVIESEGPRINRLVEKPSLNFFINAGIYLLEPAVLAHISDGERLDMPDLIQRLIGDGAMVVSFPIHEYWIDVGQPDDYLRAQEDLAAGRVTRASRG